MSTSENGTPPVTGRVKLDDAGAGGTPNAAAREKQDAPPAAAKPEGNGEEKPTPAAPVQPAAPEVEETVGVFSPRQFRLYVKGGVIEMKAGKNTIPAKHREHPGLAMYGCKVED